MMKLCQLINYDISSRLRNPHHHKTKQIEEVGGGGGVDVMVIRGPTPPSVHIPVLSQL